jgi:hypothetical protein
MADPKKPFLLRLDRETFDAIQRWAADDLRSVNGQIEFLLRRALGTAGRLPERGRPARSTSEPGLAGPAASRTGTAPSRHEPRRLARPMMGDEGPVDEGPADESQVDETGGAVR